jgi:hypothetical protein
MLSMLPPMLRLAVADVVDDVEAAVLLLMLRLLSHLGVVGGSGVVAAEVHAVEGGH